MGDITLKFDSNEQIKFVAEFAGSIFDAYSNWSLNTIESLNSKLESIDSETILSVDLSNDEISLLYHICAILSDIDADAVIAGCNVSSKIARAVSPVDTTSCAFKFLAVLKDYRIPAEYCIDLFSDWCSGEGDAVLAEKCMMIQSKHNVDMTGVWEWLCANGSYPNINWPDEVNKYKEAINGCS